MQAVRSVRNDRWGMQRSPEPALPMSESHGISIHELAADLAMGSLLHLPGEHRFIGRVRLPNRDTVVSRGLRAADGNHHVPASIVLAMYWCTCTTDARTAQGVHVRGNLPITRWWWVVFDAHCVPDALFISVSGISPVGSAEGRAAHGPRAALAGRSRFLGARVCHRCVRMEWRPDAALAAPSIRSWLWNRRVHYYLCLYLLFFIWLFAFIGPPADTSNCHQAQFWPNRIQSTTEYTFESATAVADIDCARAVIRQLGRT